MRCSILTLQRTPVEKWSKMLETVVSYFKCVSLNILVNWKWTIATKSGSKHLLLSLEYQWLYSPQLFVLESEIIHVTSKFRLPFIELLSLLCSVITYQFTSIFTHILSFEKILFSKYASSFSFHFLNLGSKWYKISHCACLSPKEKVGESGSLTQTTQACLGSAYHWLSKPIKGGCKLIPESVLFVFNWWLSRCKMFS